MSIVEVPAPEGAIIPTEARDLRQLVEPSPRLFSSPEAQSAAAHAVRQARNAAMASQLGASEREVEMAYTLLLRYVADSGAGHAGDMTVDLIGLRHTSLSRRGVWVRGDEPDRITGAALLADPLVLLAFSGPVPSLHWTLLPGGPSVTARADALRFLRAVASGGTLTFRFNGNEPITQVEADETRWQLNEEWRLFEDLATLEEWSGTTIPMPDVVTGHDATLLGQAATWARTQTVDARISGAIGFRAENDAGAGYPDELRLLHEFRVRVLGVEIPLGQGIATVPIARVERLDDPELTHHAWPTGGDVTFRLGPPPSRRLPPHRTQPVRVSPAPRSAGSTDAPHYVRRAHTPLRRLLPTHPPRPRSAGSAVTTTAALLDDIRGR